MKISRDINGNKTLSVDSTDLAGARGFSVQTLGYLPKTHRDGIGAATDNELRAYIRDFGTARQKELFGI